MHKTDAYQFFKALQEHLNRSLPPTSEVRRQVELAAGRGVYRLADGRQVLDNVRNGLIPGWS